MKLLSRSLPQAQGVDKGFWKVEQKVFWIPASVAVADLQAGGGPYHIHGGGEGREGTLSRLRGGGPLRSTAVLVNSPAAKMVRREN